MSKPVYEAETRKNQRSSNLSLAANHIFRDDQSIVLARGRDESYRNKRNCGIKASLRELPQSQ